MPSSHSSLVIALATATGLRQGFDSSLFAIATVLAFVVLYDAQGIRRQAGNQARIINRMLQNVENAGIKVDKNLKRIIGAYTNSSDGWNNFRNNSCFSNELRKNSVAIRVVSVNYSVVYK